MPRGLGDLRRSADPTTNHLRGPATRTKLHGSMGPAGRCQDTDVGVLLTREVRWFFPGDIPPSVYDWFTANGRRGEHERRVDYYDVALARIGVGAKSRNIGTLETKLPLSSRGDVDLGGSARGCIEDWVKVCAPVGTPATTTGSHVVAVHKNIVTRRHDLRSSSDDATAVGYDVELVSIRSGGLRAWSICVETFGGAEHRTSAFRSGVAELLHDAPAPDDLALTGEWSCGYPTWIARYAASDLPTNHIGERRALDWDNGGAGANTR